MVRATVDEVDPEQTILFGSRVRREERARSGVDLLATEAPFGLERIRRRVMNRLYRTLRGLRPPTDALVFSQEDIEYSRLAHFTQFS